jgi:hypothetical protein
VRSASVREHGRSYSACCLNIGVLQGAGKRTLAFCFENVASAGSPFLEINLQLLLQCACAATAMRERCDFQRSTIAIENALIDFTFFILRIRTRIAVAIENAFIHLKVFRCGVCELFRH